MKNDVIEKAIDMVMEEDDSLFSNPTDAYEGPWIVMQMNRYLNDIIYEWEFPSLDEASAHVNKELRQQLPGDRDGYLIEQKFQEVEKSFN